MSNKFAVAARRAAKSPIMEGRTKIATDEIIEKYPNGITLCAFDIIETVKGGYAVFNFAEDLSRYVNGGKNALDIAEAWADMYDGDIPTASKELKAEGGYKVRLVRCQTKDGKPFVAWEEAES